VGTGRVGLYPAAALVRPAAEVIPAAVAAEARYRTRRPDAADSATGSGPLQHRVQRPQQRRRRPSAHPAVQARRP
jgi:hypothetical protein